MKPPNYETLKNLAITCFSLIDYDDNQHIDYDEYLSWIKNNDHFLEFILKYSGTQTYANAKRI